VEACSEQALASGGEPPTIKTAFTTHTFVCTGVGSAEKSTAPTGVPACWHATRPSYRESNMAHDNSWADVLERELEYLVIRKANRLQVLVRPTTKQMRTRGKRDWTLVAAIPPADADSSGNAQDELREAVLNTLSEMTPGHPEQAKKGKAKKGRAKKPKAEG